MDSAAMDSVQRRLQILSSHLHHHPGGNNGNQLKLQATLGEYFIEQGYSVVLPEKLNTGNWNVYRSARSPLKLIERNPDHPEIGTLHDNFLNAIKSFRDMKYLGSRLQEGGIGEYKWMTYGEVGSARTAIGSALLSLGITKGSRVGLYFINRPEWIITDHACSSYSLVSVPLYDTLGPDAVKYIINHASLAAVFCTPDKLQTILSSISELPSVRVIVVVGGDEKLIPVIPTTSGVEILSYDKLEILGRNNMRAFLPPSPDDIATICYTSGTTGTPKGAMLSHGNLIASTSGVSLGVQLSSSDIYVSYLPLAHIYERANVIGVTTYGVAIGFYQGDVLKLMDDMAVLRPTIFASVPRLYNRIYDGITNAVRVSGGLRERLFNVAFNAKKKALENGRVASPIWDRLVFKKIQAKLGGRVRIMLSGASPMSPDVLNFLRICFGGRVSEGYGMTETACTICFCEEGDMTLGHVGPPNPACEIKLIDVPEMSYTTNDKPYPRGEICVRGPIIFKGYYKDEQQTREILDVEGWLHTGDIGAWLPDGKLKIIDRKKNIFKLAQGEYIAPEKIEIVYGRSTFVSQCFIYGDSFNSSLVAIVVVDPEALTSWAQSQGIMHADDINRLCNDPKVIETVLMDMNAVGSAAQLRGFEFAKAVTLISEPFTLENGLLTPTFKIKRHDAKAYFAKAIAEMYATLTA